MQLISIIFLFFIMTPIMAQQKQLNKKQQPSAELLEFLAEFNMQSEHDDKDFDLIQHHALQDLKNTNLEEKNNEHQ